MKTQNKILLSLLLIFPVLLTLIISCSDEDDKQVTKILLNQYRVELNVTETFNLIATLQPDNVTNEFVTWESENKNIATVDNNGKVTALELGETNIIAKVNSKEAACKVVVKTSGGNGGGNGGGTGGGTGTGSIYAAGGHPSENAKVWKDGKLLYDFSGAKFAYSVYVSGNDVYTAGGDPQAKVWKNDKLLYDLPDGKIANAVIVNGNDVYAVGRGLNGNKIQAKVWKNGSLLYDLPDGMFANAVAIVNNELYISGAGLNIGKVWKNNTLLYDLPESSNCTSIFVVGNDIYTGGAGFTNGTIKGKIWKNSSILYNMPEVVSSIYFNAGYIYSTNHKAVYKNEKLLYDFLGLNPNSLSIYNNDIYIAGGTNSTSGLVWKNGTLLYTFPHSNTSALSIFVK